jgi:hypothetical protein
MKGLDTRIAKLERASGLRDNVLTIILVCFQDAELRGYRWQPFGHRPIDTLRVDGETNDQLLARAKSNAIPQNGCITLSELRGNAQDDETQE